MIDLIKLYWPLGALLIVVLLIIRAKRGSEAAKAHERAELASMVEPTHYHYEPEGHAVVIWWLAQPELFRTEKYAPWETPFEESVWTYIQDPASGVISNINHMDIGKSTLRFQDEESARAFITRYPQVVD